MFILIRDNSVKIKESLVKVAVIGIAALFPVALVVNVIGEYFIPLSSGYGL
jgi:hypothetical protein